MQKFDYDVAVIGGGSAGYSAARIAASSGLKTIVIEGGKQVGGLCILRGCMPSKALLYAAEVYHLARTASTWGVHAKSVRFNFGEIMERKRRLISEFADYRRKQLENGKFRFIRADACFCDPHTVELSPIGPSAGRGRKLRAKHFVIATGSIVAPSPLPALNQVGYWTSDEALSLKRLPKSLIILGGGSVAIELAQFFARLDVKVTVVQRSSHVLKESDADAASVVETVLRREGVKLFTDTHLLDAWRSGSRKGVAFAHQEKTVRVEAEKILFALGRSPNTANLALGNAGVKMDNLRILVNSQMQTNVPHIYAAGDCCGLHEIVHIAVMQGETAARNIAKPRRPQRMDYRLYTSVVFTEPQLATVGLTEKEARARKIPYLAASYPFNDHGKSLIMNALDGFVKLLANPKTGEIIGGACVGPHGGELIHEIVAAMNKRMTVHELAAMPHYHPTLAEIWTYPAEELAEKI